VHHLALTCTMLYSYFYHMAATGEEGGRNMLFNFNRIFIGVRTSHCMTSSSSSSSSSNLMMGMVSPIHFIVIKLRNLPLFNTSFNSFFIVSLLLLLLLFLITFSDRVSVLFLSFFLPFLSS